MSYSFDLEVLSIALVIGVIPGLIAQKKGESFIKWWIFGAGMFVIALPMVIILKPKVEAHKSDEKRSDEYKKCPYCAELIRIDAIYCRFCEKSLYDRGGKE